MLLAFFAICMAQGVVWYTGFFYTQFFLERTLKINSQTVNVLMIAGGRAFGAALHFLRVALRQDRPQDR